MGRALAGSEDQDRPPRRPHRHNAEAALDQTLPIAAIAIALRLREKPASAFFSWQARIAAAVAAHPGFLSIEFTPMLGEAHEWRMVVQVRDAQSLAAWRASEPRRELHREVLALLDQTAGLEEAAAPDLHAQGSVTEVITTRVRPGVKTAYLDWAAKIQEAQAAFPGYRGTYLQAPSRQQEFWTTLIRFATPGELDAWLASRERGDLVAQSEALVEAWSSHRLAEPFAGWFPAEEARATPPSWKQAMVVLLVLFPIVVLELRFFAPVTRGLDAVVGTFIGNALSVGLLTWPLMPVANRALDWWLRPRSRTARRTTLLGSALMIALYIAEILAFEWLAHGHFIT
jgi:antibiotic biosynthesis monooxygenase (ABM) superfamily enzyme